MTQLSPVALAIAKLGGAAEVARQRGLKTGWGVSQWIRRGIPADHVLWLSERTAWAYTPHQLAPALYPHPDDGLPGELRSASEVRAA